MVKVVSGDPYRIQQAQKDLIADFLKNNDPLNLEIIDLKRSEIKPSDLISRLNSVSIFAPRRLIILENVSANADFTKYMEEICQATIEGVTLLIILSKSEKTSEWARSLRKLKGYQDYKPYQGAELIRWLCLKADSLGTFLKSTTAEYLVNRVGSELFILDSELRKLSVYPEVTPTLIDELTAASPNSQIFELLQNILQGNLERSLVLYEEQRQQKNEPLAMLGALIWQLQLLVIVKLSPDPAEKTAKYFELHVFPVKKARASVSKMSLHYLNTLLELCRQTDRNIKVSFMNPDEAMKYLILRCASLAK